MKKKLIMSALAAAPVSLFVASSALAVPPTGFSFDPNAAGGFTATAGVVTSDCAGASATCTPLQSGTGILQERATTTGGTEFIHTIIVEDTADTSGPLTFYNNSFVNADNTGGGVNDVGIKSFVDLSEGSASGDTTALIGRGALQGTNEASRLTVLQNQTLNGVGGHAIDVNYAYYDDGGDGHYLRIDEIPDSASSSRGGAMTIRSSGGGFTCITPDTPAATENGNPGCGSGSITLNSGEVVTYADGDELHTVLFRTENFGINATADSIIEFQKVVVGGNGPGFPTDLGADTGGTDYDSLNDEAFGVFVANDPGAAAGTSWPAWDGNFGTAPTFNGADGSLAFPP